jgi:predicted acyltransferase (DUF342 family)
MTLLLLSILAFALILIIPAIPTLLEVYRPKDDVQLHISEHYVRDPRWFGTALRKMLAPFVAAAHGDASFQEDVKLRTDEEVYWAPDMTVEADKRMRGISVGERVRVGRGAGIRDAYALESLDVEREVTARTLTSDGVMHIGESVNILRWIDANGEITVGADSNLGVSASGGSRLTLGERVEFERVWGSPVATRTAATDPFEFAKRKNERRKKTILIGQAEVDAGASMIHYGPVRVTRDTHIPSHIKVHGPLEIEPGVRIGGNVIVRGDLTLASDVAVSGHLFAEGDVRIGPRSRVGRSGGVKTVYAGRRLLIANDVEIEGWVVADSGGNTV